MSIIILSIILLFCMSWARENNIYYSYMPYFKEYEPELTWKTTIPKSVSNKCLYREYANRVEVQITIKSTDNNGTEGLTVSLPSQPINNSEITVMAQQLLCATWADPCAYVDQITRLVGFGNFMTFAEFDIDAIDKSLELKIFVVYERSFDVITLILNTLNNINKSLRPLGTRLVEMRVAE